MQLVQPLKFFSVIETPSIGSVDTLGANWGYVAIFSNTEKSRRLYSHYGSCMPIALFSEGVYTPLVMVILPSANIIVLCCIIPSHTLATYM